MSEAVLEESCEMKDDDNFSNSPECSSDDEDVDEEQVAQLQKQVDAGLYNYDLHTQLISKCHSLGDLEKLRAARERMHSIFPLTPELWLDWLSDEKGIASTPEQKNQLNSLFERALKDYPCVSVWMEYVQFSIGSIGESWEGLKTVREVFERALTSVGLHVTQGYLIWETYREFETAYLQFLKTQDADTEQIKEQIDRICDIFKRQLSVPLIGMDKTYSEFTEVEEFGPVSSAIEYSYKKALQKLEKLQEYEDKLSASETPHFEEYKSYIEFEKKNGEPVRVQNIFERALIENCLREELWSDYTKYVDNVIQIREMSLPVHERAIRNCPWTAPLWSSFCRAMERYEEPHDKITEKFENALAFGFSKAEDFKELWLAYLDYLKRRIDKQQMEDTSDENKFRDILDVFDRATTQMAQYFYGSEPEYAIMKYFIYFTAKYKKDLEGSRKLWKEIINHGHKEGTQVWLDFANFERLHGDGAHYRRVLFQAISSVSDWQETFVDLLVTFEREEGTLQTFEKTLAKVDEQMKIVNEKRLKILAEANNLAEEKSNRASKRKLKHESGNKAPPKTPIQMDSDGFKIPPPPEKLHSSPDQKDSPSKKRRLEEKDTSDSKKRKVETLESHGASVRHDSSKDDRTVFVSNLSFDVDEGRIKQFFSEIGDVEEVRLVKNYKGKSKGFCYVVYKYEDHARQALGKDRAQLDGRPMLISPCEDRKNNPVPQQKFKFATGLEKNKLFVKGLPFSTTKEDIENMFKEHGALKEVRLVTYRNGHSKGLAYVEYVDQACAANAVVKMDGTMVMENVISVAISNPPPRKPKNEFIGSLRSESLGAGAGAAKGPRGRGRTQLSLVPRSVAKPTVGRKPGSTNGSMQNGQKIEPMDTSDGPKPLSNSDFANMFRK